MLRLVQQGRLRLEVNWLSMDNRLELHYIYIYSNIFI